MGPRARPALFRCEVHFPDARIEYQEADGRWDHEDVEVVTAHYRGAHGASVGAVGLLLLSRIESAHGGRSGGGEGRSGGLAEEMWR